MNNKLEISDCTEDAFRPKGKKPLTLLDLGTDRLLNRHILKWSWTGNYGMGSAGFFKMLLDSKSEYPKEWLILALWNSCSWLLLDGERLDKQNNYTFMPFKRLFAGIARIFGTSNGILRPILSRYSVPSQPIMPISRWDGVDRKLIGSKIYDVDITESHSLIKLKKKSKLFVLEILLSGHEFPSGDGWNIECNHLQAWLVSTSGKIYC